MSEFVEVKISDLTGAALDWATGIADGREVHARARCCQAYVVWADPFTITLPDRPVFHDKSYRKWEPSTDWATGGPLLAKNFQVICGMYPSTDMWPTVHNQLLPWAMRAIVEFHADEADTVVIPKELMA